MSQLAMLGGTRTVREGTNLNPWPVVTDDDEQAVLRVLRSGRLVLTAAGEEEVAALELEWAARVGVAHCAAVSSGTAALQVALAALRIGPGDEVILPALTMSATAHAVHRSMATPIFADIEPTNFVLDAERVREMMGPRTAALLPVHLHGLPADMDALTAIASPAAVPIVEDAAQSHGAAFQGTMTGALGTIGCFSLHPSKNLPACGEGGLVTTDSAELHHQILQVRNFGERPPTSTRSYVARSQGHNHRLSPVQAAFTRSQLCRFDRYARVREQAVAELLARLTELPGIAPPDVPAGRTHAWHIIRLRLLPEELGLDGVAPSSLRQALHRVLRAEGVAVSQYQAAPLPAHPAFRSPDTSLDEVSTMYPNACAVVDGSLCIQRRHLGPAAPELLTAYGDAFEKVWDNLDLVRRMADSQPHKNWRTSLADEENGPITARRRGAAQ